MSETLICAHGRERNPPSSTGETSPSRPYPLFVTLAPVDKSPPLSREEAQEALREHVLRLLRAANTNPTRIAIEAGLNPRFVTQWLSGRVRSPGTANLKKIADLLGLTLEELITPVGETTADGREYLPENIAMKVLTRPRATAPGGALPVRYVVQAGAWYEVDDLAQESALGPPVYADDRYPAHIQWLELVRGDSVDLLYPEGTWVHVVDAIALGYVPQHGDFVVVERKRHHGGMVERSLKQIVQKGNRIELWPRSRSPKWQQPLELGDGEEDTTVEVSALVIGGYLPARR